MSGGRAGVATAGGPRDGRDSASSDRGGDPDGGGWRRTAGLGTGLLVLVRGWTWLDWHLDRRQRTVQVQVRVHGWVPCTRTRSDCATLGATMPIAKLPGRVFFHSHSYERCLSGVLVLPKSPSTPGPRAEVNGRLRVGATSTISARRRTAKTAREIRLRRPRARPGGRAETCVAGCLPRRPGQEGRRGASGPLDARVWSAAVAGGRAGGRAALARALRQTFLRSPATGPSVTGGGASFPWGRAARLVSTRPDLTRPSTRLDPTRLDSSASLERPSPSPSASSLRETRPTSPRPTHGCAVARHGRRRRRRLRAALCRARRRVARAAGLDACPAVVGAAARLGRVVHVCLPALPVAAAPAAHARRQPLAPRPRHQARGREPGRAGARVVRLPK